MSAAVVCSTIRSVPIMPACVMGAARMVKRNAVNASQTAVKVFQIGDHHLIPQTTGFQVADQMLIDFSEFA